MVANGTNNIHSSGERSISCSKPQENVFAGKNFVWSKTKLYQIPLPEGRTLHCRRAHSPDAEIDSYFTDKLDGTKEPNLTTEYNLVINQNCRRTTIDVYNMKRVSQHEKQRNACNITMQRKHVSQSYVQKMGHCVIVSYNKDIKRFLEGTKAGVFVSNSSTITTSEKYVHR